MFCFYIDLTKLWVTDEEQNQKISILFFTICCLKQMQTKKDFTSYHYHSCENYSTRTNRPKAMKRIFMSIKIMQYFAFSFYPLWVLHSNFGLMINEGCIWSYLICTEMLDINILDIKYVFNIKPTMRAAIMPGWPNVNILAYEQGRVTLLLISQENSCKVKFSIPNICYS